MNYINKAAEIMALAHFGKDFGRLTPQQMHYALSRAVMAHVAPKWEESRVAHAEGRCAYYLSAEFLVGRAIHNNLICSGAFDKVADQLELMGMNFSGLDDAADAALGNGGLGRLAACFMDSAATLRLPLDGYGIRYRYGLFKQHIEGGFQQETPDDWTAEGDPWSVRRDDETVRVPMGGFEVLAVPYDMPVIGYKVRHVGTIRLWQSEPTQPFDFDKFNDCKYDEALKQKNRAEDISRVLYPNDSTEQGRLLRLRQQYFFASASLQDILRRYKKHHGSDYSHLCECVCLQLNDTHPVIAIPELIRLLMADGVGFSEALEQAKQIFNYTNHTVMPEALEKWDLRTVRRLSPQIARIILRINTAMKRETRHINTPEEMLIVHNNTVYMANLACYCSAHINGVAKLHTDIIKERVLRGWFELYPNRFSNKTNGITPRRWLLVCNRELSRLITELTGSERWVTNLKLLRGLEKYADDDGVLDRFIEIKQHNKRILAEYIGARGDGDLDVGTCLDVQIKRLHEYKRQLLNILCILELYFEIKEGSLRDFTPTTFLFGAKAAPGYYRAKGIIKLINEVAGLIARDPEVSRFIKVIFVSDYNVSYAEKIIAAADVSEQISTAGTEASGTGNMKLMLNSAVTLGTYDGANIEIVEEAGEHNNYIFGSRVEDIEALGDGYNPRGLYEGDGRIKRCLDALVDGTLDDGGTGMFRELYSSLLDGAHWHRPDHYYLLLDFDSCLQAKKQVAADYRDRRAFARKQWLNMCAAGKFSADRTVKEYARQIWHIEKCK